MSDQKVISIDLTLSEEERSPMKSKSLEKNFHIEKIDSNKPIKKQKIFQEKVLEIDSEREIKASNNNKRDSLLDVEILSLSSTSNPSTKSTEKITEFKNSSLKININQNKTQENKKESISVKTLKSKLISEDEQSSTDEDEENIQLCVQKKNQIQKQTQTQNLQIIQLNDQPLNESLKKRNKTKLESTKQQNQTINHSNENNFGESVTSIKSMEHLLERLQKLREENSSSSSTSSSEENSNYNSNSKCGGDDDEEILNINLSSSSLPMPSSYSNPNSKKKKK